MYLVSFLVGLRTYQQPGKLSKVFIHQLMNKSVVLKNNIKIYIKTAPTCFGAVTPSSASALFVLAKVTVVKIAN